MLFLFLFAIVAVVGAIIYSQQAESKRDNEMKALAKSLFMEYSPVDAGTELFERCRTFKLMTVGRKRKIRNLISLKDGDLETHFFDYQYIVSSGKNSHKKTVTAVHINSTAIKLPQFMLRPEHVGDKIAEKFGYKDIDFEENKGFSKDYFLKGEDDDVRRLFNINVLQHFSNNKGWFIETRANQILLHRNKRTSIQTMHNYYRRAIEIAKLLVKEARYLNR